MAKYLKTAFFKEIELLRDQEYISYGKMLEIIQDEVIINYKQDNTFRKKLKRFFKDIWLGIKVSNNIKENNQIF
jgi:hypothetical protein